MQTSTCDHPHSQPNQHQSMFLKLKVQLCESEHYRKWFVLSIAEAVWLCPVSCNRLVHKLREFVDNE
jgi:hypothetical protein